MKKPLIGLTTYPDSDTHGWHTPTLYVDAVIRAGGVPVQLPCMAIDAVETWADRLDGIVFIGGGDLNPKLYGGTHHKSIYNLNDERDLCEMQLMATAIEKNIPSLAICRGLQVLNTLMEGSLYEHIPDEFGEQTLHRLPPRNDVLHPVAVDANSRLANLLGTHIETASWHHQAIKQLGKGLSAVAWAPDGIIEAVELDGNPMIVAVQWHPEITAMHDNKQQGLFNWLIEQAS